MFIEVEQRACTKLFDGNCDERIVNTMTRRKRTFREKYSPWKEEKEVGCSNKTPGFLLFFKRTTIVPRSRYKRQRALVSYFNQCIVTGFTKLLPETEQDLKRNSAGKIKKRRLIIPVVIIPFIVLNTCDASVAFLRNVAKILIICIRVNRAHVIVNHLTSRKAISAGRI